MACTGTMSFWGPLGAILDFAGVAGGERVPPAPLDWYCLKYCENMIRPFAYYFNTQHIFTISVDKIRLQPLLTTSTFDQIISAYILFTTSPLNLYALLHTFISKFSQVFSSTSFLSLVQQYSSHFLQAPARRAGPACKLILCRVSSVVLANF